MSDEGLSRRDLLKKAGLGGAVLLGGSLIGAASRDRADAAEYQEQGEHPTHTAVGEDVLDAVYGHSGVPRGISSDGLDAVTFPPSPDGKPPGTVREVEIAVEERLIEVADGVHIEASATTTGPTGVEMEALTAASIAALTVYDMTKALDKSIEIREIQLLEKTGGKGGDYRRE